MHELFSQALAIYAHIVLSIDTLSLTLPATDW